MKNFINAKELQELIENNEEIVIIDVRYNLHDKGHGEKVYNDSHILNAFYLDIDIDLAGEKKPTGGSRPVPKIHKYIDKIKSMGIGNNTSVILYDENMITASRAFWMFKYIGHDKVKILDGGYQAWLKSNGKTTKILPLPHKSEYNYTMRQDIFCNIDEVKEHIKNKSSILVECRSYDRYLGNNEPFYDKAGHIPTAICIDSKSLLKNGRLKPIEELKEIMESLSNYKNVVFYCGSGINAALDYVVFDELGQNSKVYIGGFSDWISHEENHVEIKDEN